MSDIEEDPFESAKLCVATAREFIEEFTALAKNFHDGVPAEMTIERNVAGEQLFYLTLTTSPPAKLRARMAGAVTELRNALDQATFATASRLGTTHPDKTYFPMLAKPDDWEHAFSSKGRCRGVPDSIRAFLRALEPWPTGTSHDGGNDSLYVLGRISGPNKHRVSLRPKIATSAVRVNDLHATAIIELMLPPHINASGTKAHFLHIPADATAKFRLEYGLSIVFSGDTEVANKEVAAFLNEALSIVEGIVLGIEAETARIANSAP